MGSYRSGHQTGGPGDRLGLARHSDESRALLVESFERYATYAGIAGVDPADGQAVAAHLPPLDSLAARRRPRWGLPRTLGPGSRALPRSRRGTRSPWVRPVPIRLTATARPSWEASSVAGTGIERCWAALKRYKLLVGADAHKWNNELKRGHVSQDATRP